MDIFLAHLGVDDSGVHSVGEDLGLFGGQMLGEKFDVEHFGEFGAAILWIGTYVAVDFFDRGELGVGRCTFVEVGADGHDADCVSVLRCLLEQGKEMGSQDDVTDMIECEVTVHTIVGELVGHDTTTAVVDQDI